MTKKDGSSKTKTIEQVREATQADIKRVKDIRPSPAKNRGI
jgi:hypothetical protein